MGIMWKWDCHLKETGKYDDWNHVKAAAAAVCSVGTIAAFIGPWSSIDFDIGGDLCTHLISTNAREAASNKGKFSASSRCQVSINNTPTSMTGRQKRTRNKDAQAADLWPRLVDIQMWCPLDLDLHHKLPSTKSYFFSGLLGALLLIANFQQPMLKMLIIE